MSEPFYIEHPVEYVRNVEALWGKLESRRYDWIGVGTDGQFVVGRPPMGGRLTSRVHLQVQHGGASGDFTVAVRDPLGELRNEPCVTRQEADELYERLVRDFESHSGPLLVKVTLQDRDASEVRQQLIVRKGNFDQHRMSDDA